MDFRAGVRVYVAGHLGMVGQALLRRLEGDDVEILTAERDDLDLRDQRATQSFLTANRPDIVYIAAARTGGIQANIEGSGEYLYDNLMIAANLIEGARIAEVHKLVFVASSAVYPADAPQPYNEDSLLSGPYDMRHEGYAMAKLAGIKLCQTYRRQYGCDFISVMPTNLYGPNDNYDEGTSHVLAALMRRFDEAQRLQAPEVCVWGTGAARREFLHADDLADALVFLGQRYSGSVPLNIGSGEEVEIAELARLLADTVGYQGRILFDPGKPEGALRRALDCSRLHALGWNRVRPLRRGLEQSYEAYCRSLR